MGFGILQYKSKSGYLLSFIDTNYNPWIIRLFTVKAPKCPQHEKSSPSKKHRAQSTVTTCPNGRGHRCPFVIRVSKLLIMSTTSNLKGVSPGQSEFTLTAKTKKNIL